MPCTVGSASVNGANVTDADALARDVHRLRLDLVAVDLERHRHVGRRLGALVGDAGGDGDALLAGERRAREGDRRHREVRSPSAADRHRRQRHALGEVDVLGAAPAGLLEVGDQDRFAPLQRRARRGCSRPASAPGRSASRPTSTFAASSAASSRPRSEVARMFSSALRLNSTSVARSSAPSESIALRAASLRALPVIAVAHARRLIEQDDDLAAAAGGGERRRGALREERPRERRDDQRDRRRAHQQQRTSGGSAAAAPTDTESLHEHQRRELDDPLPLALNQVHEHRNGDGAEADEEERGQE